MELSPFTKAFIFTAALLAMSLVSTWHYADVLTDEAIEKEARPKRIAEDSRRGSVASLSPYQRLTMPLRCEDQWIRKQLPDGRWRVSCVVVDFSTVTQ